jgi:hypothetical protein
MLIVRQPSREATGTAFAARCGRLFGGQALATTVYSDCVKGSRTDMPISRVLEHKNWRSG